MAEQRTPFGNVVPFPGRGQTPLEGAPGGRNTLSAPAPTSGGTTRGRTPESRELLGKVERLRRLRNNGYVSEAEHKRLLERLHGDDLVTRRKMRKSDG